MVKSEIIKNNLNEMKIPQALSMLEELFKGYDLNDKNSIWFNDLIEVIKRDYQDKLDRLDRWNKVSLTKAQKLQLMKDNLSDEEIDNIIKEKL